MPRSWEPEWTAADAQWRWAPISSWRTSRPPKAYKKTYTTLEKNCPQKNDGTIFYEQNAFLDEFGQFLMNKMAFLAKMRCRQKLVLTFLIRRLGNRGKNGCKALSETNRSTFSDFENNVYKVFEKSVFGWKSFRNFMFF